jgi:asparagine synthase (glutamine-hydrolysing)
MDAVRGFLPRSLVALPKYRNPAPWLNSDFVKRNRIALQGYETRLRLFGPLPTFQENLSTLRVLQRQLPCEVLSPDLVYEKTYPYLDRGFLEFIYSVPREKLVRPGLRRALMRRALAGIVPDELLNRKRKAYVARAPMAAISTEWPTVTQLAQVMLTGSMGIVDPTRFSAALQRARSGQEVAVQLLLRTLGIELWLKRLAARNVPNNLNSRTDEPKVNLRSLQEEQAHLKTLESL